MVQQANHRTVSSGRRDFIARAARFAGGTMLVASAAPLLEAKPARSAQTTPDDPRLEAKRIVIPKHASGLQCYWARPASPTGWSGGVVVMHDILGLTPHFEDVTRRCALEGFAALAPDYASRYGGTPSEPDPAREVVSMVTWPEMIADTHAALAWLKMHAGGGKTGAVGFGLGGSALGRAVMETPDLTAAAMLYGRVPPLANVAAIKAPLLLIYAGEDAGVDADVPAFVDALQKAGLHPEVVTYPSVQHGFDDDSAPARFAPETAKLAWSRTVEFLRHTIG